MDVSGEEGTGRWTVDDALQKGVPLSLIGEAVFSRYLSRLKDIRGEVAHCFGRERMDGKTKDCMPIGLDGLKDALYCSRVICHTQGFMLLKAASGHYGWGLDLSSIASINYFYWLSSNELPANLIQAMRDYFGAHTYERRDRPGEGPFHTRWDLDRGSGRV